METMTWFKMFLFLIVIGTFMSLMHNGAALNDMGLSNLTFNTTAISETPATSCAGWWDIVCIAGQYTGLLAGYLTLVIDFVWQAGVTAIALVSFFTGITALLGIGGAPVLPAPFGVIMAVVVVFMWLFLLLDVVGRFVGAISKGSGG